MNTFKILLISAALVTSSQAFAQGIYFGPNDVGANAGPALHRDYRGDGDRYGDRGFQEGRSVAQPIDRSRDGRDK